MDAIKRRKVLQSLPLSVVPLAGCSSQDRSHHCTDWPSFRLDQKNTGYAKEAAELGDDPAVDWAFDTEGDIWGSPVICDGTVYIGSADSHLYAIDSTDGEETWRYGTDHRIEGTPAVHRDTVYFGSYDRSIYALDANDGKRRWSFETDGVIRSSPTVVGDTVYIGVGCVNLACAAYTEEELPEVGWVYALDRESGDLRWRSEFETEVVSTPAVLDGTLYVGCSDTRLYALDTSSGEQQWEYQAEDWIWSSPSVDGDSVFMGDFDSKVIAVDRGSGEEQWTFDTFGSYISGSTAVDEDTVYIGVTPSNHPQSGQRENAEIFAIDRDTGEELWSYETEALEIGSSPVITDEHLYIGTHAQVPDKGTGVYALTKDGEEQWFFDVDGRGVGSSPALVDGTLYFGAANGKLYALG
jgi:outer membrane protein assembly factor BamB